MAKSLTPTGVALAEEAAHLLRRAPAATLVCHLLGSAPLALALLLFWSDINSIHTSDTTVARDSTVLAFLLVWMNCWRAVYAGRLHRLLSAAPDSPWTWKRLWNLVAGQAFLGATKLIILPVAILTIFGFAWVMAFYRSATAMADREDLDPLQLIAHARHLAGIDRRQSWAVLPIFALLGIVLFFNLVLTLAALPFLIRMLTGYESDFSRSQGYYVFTPLFFWSVAAVSWMLFDPFVQAVYCIRSFRGESLTTGEDIRAGLRMLSTAAVALLLILLPMRSFAAVERQQLQQSVQKAMQNSEYDWRLPAQASAARTGDSWLVRVTDRFINGMKSVLQSIGKAIDSFLEWLRDLFKLPGMPKAGALPTSGLHWTLYLLIALVVVVFLWIAWRRRWFQPRRQKTESKSGLEAIRLDADDLTADRLPEEGWLDLAARSVLEKNYRFALRAYYLANLAWLGRMEYISIHPGKTNREYSQELQRRARAFPEARGWFGDNIRVFERAWYGQHAVEIDDVDQFRERMEQIKAALRVRQGAAA